MIFDFLFTIFFVLLLPVLWFIREIKAINFWLYLWQLKEYHTGRFIDHFRTSHGQKLLFDKLVFLKVALILVIAFGIPYILDAFDPEDLLHLDLLFGFSAIGIIFFVYALEGVKAARDFFGRSLRIPVPTKKIVILRLILVSGTILFVFSPSLFVIFSLPFPFDFNPYVALLFYDIITPLIVSVVVLSFQPFAILGKRRIIQKATEKRATLTNLKVIGITGSYGKTSTKEFLFAILQKKFRVVKTPEHRNSEIGVSQTILQDLQEDTEVFVCEMGAYGKGGIKLLANIAKPQIGMLTGINEQHMATFGSQENIITTKYELIESLSSNGIAFFNAKNSYCVELYNKTTIKKILYGQAARFQGEENILGAMAVAKELGMSDEEISIAVKEIGNTFPGTQIRKGAGGLTIIDATYSANPDGVIAGLEYLKTWPGKKVIIMPCLIELGKASKEVHKRIGEKIAEVCDLAIITTRDRFEDIGEGAVAKGMPQENLLFLEDPKEIVEKIRTFFQKNLDSSSDSELKSITSAGDVVLLEGRVPKELYKLFYVQS